MSEKCQWVEEPDESCTFKTDCGEFFYFDDGEPRINFCLYCGKPVLLLRTIDSLINEIEEEAMS